MEEQSLQTSIARLDERVASLQDEVRHVHQEVSDLKATANRWRGAFWLFMGLAGVAGVISNIAIGWIK